MKDIISTTGLTKYYGKNRGIIDLDLNVREGEIFGFIGPNGAGKSTTLRVLLGLVAPTSGSARIFGREVGREQKKILEEIGYLPSEAMFYSGMRVSEVLKLSEKLYGKDCSTERKQLCERFDLDVRRKISELSLGNRKKAAIVSAFQHHPKLLILDEPTSGLDPLMQKEFFELVEERHHAGSTIILSSHVLPEIQQHCTRAAILREGRLIACDSVEHLAGKRCRKIEVKGISRVPSIPGIRETRREDGQVSFLFEGEMKELLDVLQGLPVEDLLITEPELEEIFLHYYEKGGALK
ncbi:MAG: ABC transporter ATP-binding protein [Eubacteriales bacterium]|nr:ABC transporter ATP-binding protein [Eubacteriales bacterium]